MRFLTDAQEEKLFALGRALVNHSDAREIVAPLERSDGFWFGSGTMVERSGGDLLLSGRYRTFGDSRTGVRAGERGVELAVFRSTDGGDTFQKIRSFTKAELSYDGREVLSIEGSCLHSVGGGLRLIVSTEKDGIGYPEGLNEYQKTGTGVWSIDHFSAATAEELDAATIEPLLECSDPRYLHVKDPVGYSMANGATALVFCTHPYCWSSANSAVAFKMRDGKSYGPPDYQPFSRGCTWDVAISRITDVVPVPRIGEFAALPRVALVFYDGGESLRNYDEHTQAKSRPRGYSCEELGGIGYMPADDFRSIRRLSVTEPAFVSPQGTGCSRYTRVAVTHDFMFATWQQSMDDRSQPLMGNKLDMGAVAEILA